ncbi:MAG: hypothetical protein H5U29_11865 [Pusillimonas sp.]|nr:hypothetical protein [Pusillimonas sp.]
MFFKALGLICCLVFAVSSWGQSALKVLDQESVSRLDLAMVRLSQRVFEYEVEKKLQEYRAFELQYAWVRFNSGENQIEFFAQIQADPTEFYCELALRDFMKKFYFGASAKLFYSNFFMPAGSPHNSYETNLYQSVYESTVFRVAIADSDMKRKFECNFYGANPKVTYSKL